MNKTILNTKEAAAYLGVSMAFLERDRWAGARIPFIKVGARAVRYRMSDLDAYLERQVRQSTSDAGEGSHGS
jgi:excisionase family DNA binding protein